MRYPYTANGHSCGQIIFPWFSQQKRYWYFLCPRIVIRTTIFMNAIIKMVKPLALISPLHSRNAFSFIEDGAKVIMQFFTSIELYSGDMNSCYWNAKEFWSEGSDTSINKTKGSNFGEGSTSAHYHIEQALTGTGLKREVDCAIYYERLVLCVIMHFAEPIVTLKSSYSIKSRRLRKKSHVRCRLY